MCFILLVFKKKTFYIMLLSTEVRTSAPAHVLFIFYFLWSILVNSFFLLFSFVPFGFQLVNYFCFQSFSMYLDMFTPRISDILFSPIFFTFFWVVSHFFTSYLSFFFRNISFFFVFITSHHIISLSLSFKYRWIWCR